MIDFQIENILSPYVLVFVYFIMLTISIIASAALVFHWNKYTDLSNKKILSVKSWYLAGVIALMLVSGVLLVFYLF